jgi:ATP-dependent DNA helicase RecQ
MKPIVIDLNQKKDGKFVEVVKTRKGYKPESECLSRTKLMVEQNMSLVNIAKQSSCTIGCIENHIAKLVEFGQLNPYRFINSNRYDLILDAIDKSETKFAKEIKQNLVEDVSYFEINLVKADQTRIKTPDNANN